MRTRLTFRLALFTVLAAPLLAAQSDAPLTGIVANKDGQPLAGVSVSSRTTCCPQKFDKGETGNDGTFRLNHPGKVIHFYKEGMQPKTVVPGAAAEVRVTVETQPDNMIVPHCKKTTNGLKRIGWGKNGIQFDVPEHGVKISGGTPDVDYVHYVIKSGKGKSFLGFWFGPYAIGLEPDDERFLSSSTFDQRSVVDSKEEPMGGQDNWGDSRSGGHWRQMAILGEGGAEYADAGPQDAALFDQIINSACVTPFPGR
jgi:hypothetical protein